MTDSFVKTYQYDNGEIQRVQVVTAESFDEFNFLWPKESYGAFGKIVNLYRNFTVPKFPWVFGRMILFQVPEDMKPIRVPGSDELCDEAKLCLFLRKSVRVGRDGLIYKNDLAREICEQLILRESLEVVRGKRRCTKILPVGNSLGFLSEDMRDAKVKVNSHFFIMDCFDVTSVFDRIGTPIGLMVKDGVVLNPPMYRREALLVRTDGSVEIKCIGLDAVSLAIGGKDITGSKIYERPTVCKVSKREKGRFAVVVGCKVVGVMQRGGFEVPSSGFVVKVPDDMMVRIADSVTYKGLEDVKFGVQVGNSFVVNGEKTSDFVEKYYNIYKQLGRKNYPPTLYPLDYQKSRAPRIGLGATKDGKPCIIWAEGPKKTGYIQGEQSCGASLSEMADIGVDLGIYNGVNLDGGGSAQVLINNRRELMISDRNPMDDTDAERAVPVGIYLA